MSAAAKRHVALGELDGSPHASGVTPRASHTARSALSWGSGGRRAMPARYAGSTAYGGNSGEREHATIAVVSTEMRDCEIAATHGHRAAPATLRLHSAYRSRDKRDEYVLQRLCVRDRCKKRHCGLLKNQRCVSGTGHPRLSPKVSRGDRSPSYDANFSPTSWGRP